jgi:hypothetical protein
MSLILDTPYIDIAIYAGSPNASIGRCHAASNSTWKQVSELVTTNEIQKSHGSTMTPMKNTSTEIQSIPNPDFSISVHGPYLRAAPGRVVHLNHVGDAPAMRHVDAMKDAALIEIIDR